MGCFANDGARTEGRLQDDFSPSHVQQRQQDDTTRRRWGRQCYSAPIRTRFNENATDLLQPQLHSILFHYLNRLLPAHKMLALFRCHEVGERSWRDKCIGGGVYLCFFCISSQICVPDHGGIALSGVHPFKFMLLVCLRCIFLVDLQCNSKWIYTVIPTDL